MIKNNYSSNDIHNRLLIMAKDFHDICEKNNIQYYILGGTLLGAVRHNGFIPWDDDMDIGLKRKDYNKLIALSKTQFPKKYELRFYKNEKKSPMHYAKFIDNTTTLIEKEYKQYIEGIYIDIFPLDGCGQNSFLDKLERKAVRFLQALVIYHCTTVKKSGIRRLVKLVSMSLSLTVLHNAMEVLLQHLSSKPSKYLVNILGAWGDREIQLKSTFGKPKLYRFEDTFLYGPENAHKYLSRVYGDYMSLPPVEKRVFRHNYYYVNFTKPYRKHKLK